MIIHSTHTNTIPHKRNSIQANTAHTLRSKLQTGTVSIMPGSCLSQGIGEKLPSGYEVALEALAWRTQKTLCLKERKVT